MTLLLPLGLLGLLGVVALIIIYIIKPNYQQRFISSTFVWKLSLKYKKKRLPISKLRNLLLIICQILLLVSLALILAKPAIVLKERVDVDEVVAIIDASASMRTETDEVIRFERAVGKVKELAEETFGKKGVISVILADRDPDFVVHRFSLSDAERFDAAMEELISDDKCSFGISDINGAINACDDIIRDNPGTKIHLFTDKTYDYPPSTVEVTDVSIAEEWNAAILSVDAELEDNSYVFTVEIASYGSDSELTIKIEVYGANSSSEETDGHDTEYEATVECTDDEVFTVIFKYSDFADEVEAENVLFVSLDDFGGKMERVYSFESAYISIDAEDNFAFDNDFEIFGGEKDKIKVLYASPMRNSFVTGMLDLMTYRMTDGWDVTYDAPALAPKTSSGDVNYEQYGKNLESYLNPENPSDKKEYDFYIFEHVMPKTLPTSGVVFLINPDKAPQNAEFTVEADYIVPGKQSVPITPETDDHPLLKGVDVASLTVSRYIRVSRVSGKYDILATCDNNPVIFSVKEQTTQVLVMAFSEHYSNVSITLSFPMLFLNVFNYYFPDAVSSNCIEVYETLTVNGRGESVDVKQGKDSVIEEPLYEFPAQLTFDTPGVYEVVQTSYYGKYMNDKVLVKIPSAESNITERGDTFEAPYYVSDNSEFFRDLLFYIEMALVILLFLEWILHLREGA